VQEHHGQLEGRLAAHATRGESMRSPLSLLIACMLAAAGAAPVSAQDYHADFNFSYIAVRTDATD
jgi:hypothetical protein